MNCCAIHGKNMIKIPGLGGPRTLPQSRRPTARSDHRHYPGHPSNQHLRNIPKNYREYFALRPNACKTSEILPMDIDMMAHEKGNAEMKEVSNSSHAGKKQITCRELEAQFTWNAFGSGFAKHFIQSNVNSAQQPGNAPRQTTNLRRRHPTKGRCRGHNWQCIFSCTPHTYRAAKQKHET